uniref:Uncharacterized protein n=1 Tax=Aegilops tauschii TaxID=37682 RepID=N1QZU7_AEGTA
MEDDELAALAAAKKRRTTTRPPPPHVPHEIVTQNLLLLPVTSLLRFKCVCKAWRETISDDRSFQRDLRLRRRDHPCFLIAPQIKIDKGIIATTGLYRWEQTHGAATLVHPLDSLPADVTHGFAHCEGLVLVGTESACLDHRSHQAFGLGRDPRTGAYKVARFFGPQCTPWRVFADYVELFAIGKDRRWRLKVERSPHHVMVHRTATFFKGSLLWTISPYDHMSRRGFLRLRVGNERFGVIPAPPCHPWFESVVSTMSELHGQLCVTCLLPHDDRSLHMWMCSDIDGARAKKPQWEKRYTIYWDWALSSLRPVAMLGDGELLCQASGDRLCRCILHTKSISNKRRTRRAQKIALSRAHRLVWRGAQRWLQQPR